MHKHRVLPVSHVMQVSQHEFAMRACYKSMLCAPLTVEKLDSGDFADIRQGCGFSRVALEP